jgi:hypothetical protein
MKAKSHAKGAGRRRAGEPYHGGAKVGRGAWCVKGRHGRCTVMDCKCLCHDSPDNCFIVGA